MFHVILKKIIYIVYIVISLIYNYLETIFSINLFISSVAYRIPFSITEIATQLLIVKLVNSGGASSNRYIGVLRGLSSSICTRKHRIMNFTNRILIAYMQDKLVAWVNVFRDIKRDFHPETNGSFYACIGIIASFT